MALNFLSFIPNYMSISSALDWRKTISIFLVIVFIVLGYEYIKKYWSEFSTLNVKNYWQLVAVGLLFLVNMALRGLFFRVVLKSFAIQLGFLESFHLSATTTMINFLLPVRAGAGFRA